MCYYHVSETNELKVYIYNLLIQFPKHYIVHPNFYYYEVYVEENAEAKSYCMFIQHVCHEGL